ncbi:amidase [Marinibacterium sp. SX1]|uniref:amidase n=1 Tax=Marinibacterium sp. SX1 TaxID=3388424 RepID=UPI003D16CC36
MELRDYVEYDGIGLSELIAKGDVSATEVAEVAAKAISATDGEVNALVEQWYGEVPITTPSRSPLAGVPFLIKDLAVTMKGRKNELGSALAEGLVMEADSTLMRRFKEAGLITLGRTTTPEFAISTTSEARATGPSRNPWNTDYNCGGSTGGSGAAVAAGMVPLAHATDGGGSIRVPASVNGIFGLKPTRGRVSNGPALDEVWSGLVSQLGLSRTVRDSAALLDAVGKPAPGEPYYTLPPEDSFLSAAGKDPKALKIGLMVDPLNGTKTAATVAATLEQTGKLLEGLGHNVEPVRVDPGVSWDEFLHANTLFWTLNTAAWIDFISSITGRPINGEYLERASLAVHEYGSRVSGMDVLGALGVRNTVSRAMGAWFEDFDVLLTPTVPDNPLRIGEYNPAQDSVDGPGWINHVFSQSPFTALANIAGLPCMSVPAGRDAETNIPIGAMYCAGFGNDAMLFSLAGQIERAAPWTGDKPRIWAGN